MSRRVLISHFLIGLIFFCFYFASYKGLLNERSNVMQSTIHSSSGIWNLPPVSLLALAGEFKGLVSDYLTLEAGARLGTEVVRKPTGGDRVVEKKYDWQSIHKIFVASQILDPSFAQTYMVAQGWLPWEPANMLAETQKIMKIADAYRQWDWYPLHTIGFNTYYFYNQPGDAGKIYLEAAKRPNAPHWLALVGARLAQKGGETESAIAILKSMIKDKDPKEPGYVDMTARLQALEGTLVIEKAVSSYEKKFGHKPSALVELTASGILSVLPPNSYNHDYCIDAEGRIFFDMVDCLKAFPNESGK